MTIFEVEASIATASLHAVMTIATSNNDRVFIYNNLLLFLTQLGHLI
jgi:hypothetical protein